MATGDWHPTLPQMLRAAVTLLTDAAAMPHARKETIRYHSVNESIRGTIYYPKSPGPSPAVLLLHTAFGLTPHERAMASRLAQEGFATLVIAYSKRTTGAVVKDNERRRRLAQIVLDGWRTMLADPAVDANRTAVLGFSLGGYFATYIASIRDLAPSAVAVYYGIYVLTEDDFGFSAPLLILQGENDFPEFVANAKKVEEQRRKGRLACEMVLYPRTGHQFDLFESNGDAARDAWNRAVAFLKQHLMGNGFE